MKKLTIFFLCAILAGCNDFLKEEAKGGVIGAAGLSSVAGLDAGLTGAYKGFLRTWARGFLNSDIQSFTMGGDDLSTIKGGNSPKFWSRELDQFNVTSGNPHLGFIWNGCYKTIQGANNIINNYQQTQVVKTGDDVMIKQIAGEAYFLRAMGYYWLVRGFGAVPLITTVELTNDMLNIGVTQPAEIYALIESDLKMAEEFVGDAKRDPGRPNKGSVKALLADVYLTMAGWPIKDASKYALAAAKAKEVIDNKVKYGFDLVPLATLWSGTDAAIGTSEEVMAFHTSKNFGGSTAAFYGTVGRPAEEGGWEDFCSEINFYNRFPAGLRKDITFLSVFNKKNDDGTFTQVPFENSIQKKPFFAKFKLADNTQWSSSMPVHMMRYAHVLLIYAEAQARSTGIPNDDAYTAVNAVRGRAGLTDLAALSNTDFINAVVDERAWEFAGEYCRWFDLVRLELVEEANSHKEADDLQPIGPITKDDYTFPIPSGEALLDPNLTAGG